MTLLKTDVTEIAVALRDLESKAGKLLPADVVEAARDPMSPLHGQFEWDDSAAAEAYRLQQAGDLIRRVKITLTVEDKPVRVVRYVSTQQEAPSSYRVVTRAPMVDLMQVELRRLLGNIDRVKALAQARPCAASAAVLPALERWSAECEALLKG